MEQWLFVVLGFLSIIGLCFQKEIRNYLDKMSGVMFLSAALSFALFIYPISLSFFSLGSSATSDLLENGSAYTTLYKNCWTGDGGKCMFIFQRSDGDTRLYSFKYEYIVPKTFIWVKNDRGSKGLMKPYPD